ncbi:MAG: hypothetical protein RR607_08870 [Akkermansia sp.]
MYNLKHKSKGERFTAQDYNNLVDAINESLAVSQSIKGGGAGSTNMRTDFNGGLLCSSGGGFSLRHLDKTGDKWQAYFNPGKVYNIGLGNKTEEKTVQIGGQDMDSTPYPALEAKDGEVYLIIKVNTEGNIESAEISMEKNDGESPWKNNDPEGMVDESGTLNFLIGKFETEDDGSLSYLPFHVGGIVVKRANNELKLVYIPDEELNPPGKGSDSTISVGEGVYKPYHKTADWKPWFVPMMVGDVLKIEEKSVKQPEGSSSLPSGRFYKIKGDGSNARIHFSGLWWNPATNKQEQKTIALEFKDGFLKYVNGEKGFNKYDITCSDLKITIEESSSSYVDGNRSVIRGVDL